MKKQIVEKRLLKNSSFVSKWKWKQEPLFRHCVWHFPSFALSKVVEHSNWCNHFGPAKNECKKPPYFWPCLHHPEPLEYLLTLKVLEKSFTIKYTKEWEIAANEHMGLSFSSPARSTWRKFKLQTRYALFCNWIAKLVSFTNWSLALFKGIFPEFKSSIS